MKSSPEHSDVQPSRWRTLRVIQWLYWIMCTVGIINIVLLLLVGRQARTDQGHFYLGSHGRFVEVSETVFDLSNWYMSIAITIHAMFFALIGFLLGLRYLITSMEEEKQKYQRPPVAKAPENNRH